MAEQSCFQSFLRASFYLWPAVQTYTGWLIETVEKHRYILILETSKQLANTLVKMLIYITLENLTPLQESDSDTV